MYRGNKVFGFQQFHYLISHLQDVSLNYIIKYQITFVIAEDPVFKRLGDDLYVDVEVDLYTAVLGGDKVVDTLDGKVKLKIKPETQNGTKVRLKGKGFPVYKKEGQFGDLIVTYSVKIPTNLTEAQKELFRQLQSMN